MPNPTLYDNFSQVRQYIDEHSGGSQDLSAYVSKTELSNCGYITTGDVSAMGYITSIPSEYITQDELSACGYLTGNDVDKFVTKNGLSEMGYITVADVSAMGYITSIPSEYITQDELSANSYLTQHQDLSAYATKSDLAFVPYNYGSYTAYVSTYTYNASGSPYLSGTVVLNRSNGLVLGGKNAKVAGEYTISNGDDAYACADNSVALGRRTYTYGWSSFGTGRDCTTYNYGEFACGGANFSSSSSYVSAHGAFSPLNSNSALETVFSVGIGVQQYGGQVYPDRAYARNAIEARWNGDFYVKGLGNYDGQNGSDASTYSLQHIINNMFSYDSSTGTLTITTF